MRFAFTEEQDLLREALAGAIARDLPVARVRDRPVGEIGPLSEVRRDGGWDGIGIAEEQGGQGGSAIEQAILVEELGRGAVPGARSVAGALAAGLLTEVEPHGCEPSAADELLADLAGGSTAVVPAISVDSTRPDVVATGGLVSGTVTGVLAAPEADALLVIVGTRLFAAEARHPGVEIVARSSIDAGRTLGDITLRKVPVRAVGESVDVERARGLGAILVMAEALGAARRLMAMTVEHVEQREQFGVPIGSFQAVKHAAADMLVDVETTHSAVYYAAWAHARASRVEAVLASGTAKSHGAPATKRVADGALALHGAVGFTWEHDLHLFLKRVHTAYGLYGSPSEHRLRIAAELDLDPASAPPAPGNNVGSQASVTSEPVAMA